MDYTPSIGTESGSKSSGHSSCWRRLEVQWDHCQPPLMFSRVSGHRKEQESGTSHVGSRWRWWSGRGFGGSGWFSGVWRSRSSTGGIWSFWNRTWRGDVRRVRGNRNTSCNLEREACRDQQVAEEQELSEDFHCTKTVSTRCSWCEA